jgi:hypothetical protein
MTWSKKHISGIKGSGVCQYATMDILDNCGHELVPCRVLRQHLDVDENWIDKELR